MCLVGIILGAIPPSAGRQWQNLLNKEERIGVEAETLSRTIHPSMAKLGRCTALSRTAKPTLPPTRRLLSQSPDSGAALQRRVQELASNGSDLQEQSFAASEALSRLKLQELGMHHCPAPWRKTEFSPFGPWGSQH